MNIMVVVCVQVLYLTSYIASDVTYRAYSIALSQTRVSNVTARDRTQPTVEFQAIKNPGLLHPGL